MKLALRTLAATALWLLRALRQKPSLRWGVAALVILVTHGLAGLIAAFVMGLFVLVWYVLLRTVWPGGSTVIVYREDGWGRPF